MKHVEFLDEDDVAVQMGPLIDCVFLLLIFFMVVALTKKSQRELPTETVTHSVTAEAEPDQPDLFMVRLEPKGLFTATGLDQPVGFADAVKAIQARAEAAPGETVWIEYRPSTPLGSVVVLLDACRSAGLGKFAFRLRM